MGIKIMIFPQMNQQLFFGINTIVIMRFIYFGNFKQIFKFIKEDGAGQFLSAINGGIGKIESFLPTTERLIEMIAFFCCMMLFIFEEATREEYFGSITGREHAICHATNEQVVKFKSPDFIQISYEHAIARFFPNIKAGGIDSSSNITKEILKGKLSIAMFELN